MCLLSVIPKSETMTADTGQVAVSEVGAVDALYRDHAAGALRLAYLIVGDRARAEDLVHEAFVRLLGRLRTIRDPQALRGYLNRSVVNLAKNHHRAESTRRRFLATQSGRPDVVTTLPDVGERYEMHRLLLALPYRQRVAIVLRYCEDLPEAVVADFLGVSAKAVRSLVGRGLATLRNEGKTDG
jgi:RNA polymerase sigma factor (sigma-70 family)